MNREANESIVQLAQMYEPFRTILIDPAWPSAKRKVKPGSKAGWLSERTRPRYGTMTATDLLDLPVNDIAARDAMLVMWATWMHLPLAMDMIRRWDFQYATGFPWLKIIQPNPRTGAMFVGGNGCPAISIPAPIYGPGVWAQHCTELVLLARRGRPFGKMGNPRPARKGIIISPRMEHSRKPDELQDWIDTKFPGPFLEMFARRRRKGWVSWGNQLED